MSLPELDPFLSWFQRNGGTIDLDAIGFKYFPSTEGGRGAVALKNIEKGRTLFTVPRSLILSIKTSSLPEKFGPKIWKECKLDTGWSGLILCMMWEDAQTLDSKWYHYLGDFCSKSEELEGTPVVEKLGKEDAERDYHDKVLLALQRRPDLFPPESIPNHYSLERYHIMGSRILSRSFDIEHAGTDDVTLEEELNNEGDRSIGSAMDVDDHDETAGAEDGSIQDGPLLEDEDENDAINVSMVPVADLLNARFSSENAKLFYEDTELKMITTKPISAGQQIWNTYNDLPNSELLRKYGHVDVLPLSGGGNGNPADVVEIRADLVLSTFLEQSGSAATSSSERIDWWLEQGGDDIFVLETNFEIPEAMTSLTRLLYLSSDEWEKARDKEKPPKPRLDSQASGLISLVLQKRIAYYPSTMKEDEEMFENEAGMPLNKYQALIRLQIAKSDSSQKRKSAPPGPNVSKKKAKR
ncbi:SET-domain protein [Lentinula guzmanii]|uniref:SET-domain protein n=1 Tax=Lentinula guzmanii TaxID=2804957 RepID=A0AA38JBZ2_9AGAR|nr:SET-domain protein [Lentinula guzmanii]